MPRHLPSPLLLLFHVWLLAQSQTNAAEDAPKPGSVRVALVTNSQASPQASAVLDLATAELSRNAQVALVERAEIQRVLAEQKLTTLQIVSAEHAVTLGKLLRADVFVSVETDVLKHDVFAVVAFDTVNGVRLVDAPLDGPVDRAAAMLADQVQQSLRKRRRIGTDLKPISLMSVRNADLPRDWDSRCHAIAFLLERRLLSIPGVAVLERRRLEHLTQENKLTEPSLAPLKASLVLIELQVGRRSPAEGLRVTAQLKTTDGQLLQTVTAETEVSQAAAAVDAMLPKLTAALNQPTEIKPPSAKSEAQRFAQEARLLYGHGDYGSALAATDAALALEPSLPMLRRDIVAHASGAAGKMLVPIDPKTKLRRSDLPPLPDSWPSAIALTNRAIDARVELFAEYTPFDLKRLLAHQIEQHILDYSLTNFFVYLSQFAPAAETDRRALQDVRDRYRKYLLQLARESSLLAERDPKAFGPYCHELESKILTGLATCAPDATRYSSDAALVIRDWLPRVEAGVVGIAASESISSRFSMLSGLAAWLDAPHFRGKERWLDPAAAAPMLALTQDMRKHRHPLVRLYGAALELRLRMAMGQVGVADLAGHWTPIREELQRTLDDPAPWPPRYTRYEAYQLWSGVEMLAAYRRTPAGFTVSANREDEAQSVRWSLEEAIRRARVMSRRREFSDNVSSQWNIGVDNEDLRPQILQALQDMVAAANLPDAEFFGRSSVQTKTNLSRGLATLTASATSKPVEPMAVPWNAVTKLLDTRSRESFTSLRLATVHQPVIRNDTVYAVGVEVRAGNQPDEPRQSALKFLAVPLRGGEPRSISRLKLTQEHNFPINAPFRAVVLTEREYILAVPKLGLVVFPLNGDEPQVLDDTRGLPARGVHSLAAMGDTLFAGLDGGYVVTIDLPSKTSHVLASARRNTNDSPLDNSSGFRVPHLVDDPERQRMVLYVETTETKEDSQSRQGLWEFRPESRVWKQLHSLPRCGLLGWGSERRGSSFLIANAATVMKFELPTDKLLAIHTVNPIRCGAEVFNDGIHKTAFGGVPPYSELNGWLWSGRRFGRLRLSDETWEQFQIPSELPKETSPPFMSGESLHIDADRGFVIVGHPYSLWRLDLPKAKSGKDGG